jgi:hypothetical protein
MSRTPNQDQRSHSEDDQDEDLESAPFVRVKRWSLNLAKFLAASMGLATAASSIYVGMATYRHDQDQKAAQKLEQSEQFARGVTLFRGTGAGGTDITLVNRNKERLSGVWVNIKDERVIKGSDPLLDLLKDKDARIDLGVVKDCSQISLDYLAIFARSKGLTRKISPNDVTVSVIFRDIDGKYWDAYSPSQIFSGPYDDGEIFDTSENVRAVDVKAEEKLTDLETWHCR